MTGGNSIVDLLGYGNLMEPVPSWNTQSTILGLTISFTTISWICILFRLYTRVCIVKSPGWDDLFVLLYLISGTTGTISICVAWKYGLGQHFLLLTSDQMTAYLQAFYVVSAAYCMSATFIKLSLLFQYSRIYERGSIHRTICMALIVIVAMWGFAFSFMAWFPSFPVSAYWDIFAPATRYAFGSLNQDIFYGTYAAHTATNLVLDIAVLFMAIPLYFREDSQTKTRFTLLGLLLLGSLVNLFSILRLASIIEHKATTSPVFDPTWYAPVAILYGVLEVEVASICASVPVFWPVITQGFSGIFVTQEIAITRAPRWDSEDEIELHRDGSGDGSGSDGCTSGSFHSRAASDSEHQKEMGMRLPPMAMVTNYVDDFTMEAVDPMGRAGVTRVEAQVKSSRPRRLLSVLEKR